METSNPVYRCRHLTTNQTKILVLVSSVAKQASTPRFNADIAQLLLRVEKAYKHAVSNPFYTPGTVSLSVVGLSILGSVRGKVIYCASFEANLYLLLVYKRNCRANPHQRISELLFLLGFCSLDSICSGLFLPEDRACWDTAPHS
jgi:hypothetical protein